MIVGHIWRYYCDVVDRQTHPSFAREMQNRICVIFKTHFLNGHLTGPRTRYFNPIAERSTGVEHGQQAEPADHTRRQDHMGEGHRADLHQYRLSDQSGDTPNHFCHRRMCSHIACFTSQIDNLVITANRMRDNGTLGQYKIRERTKVGMNEVRLFAFISNRCAIFCRQWSLAIRAADHTT